MNTFQLHTHPDDLQKPVGGSFTTCLRAFAHQADPSVADRLGLLWVEPTTTFLKPSSALRQVLK
jgi:hypothetical protein